MSHPNERDLALWAGGDLPAIEAARLSDHLEECPDCRALAERLRDSRTAVEALAAEPLDETALARVRHGLRRRLAEEEARSARRRRQAVAWALAAALAAAALGLGIWYGTGSSSEPERIASAERSELPEPDRRTVAAPAEPPAATSGRERRETRPAPEEEPGREARAATREPRTSLPPPESRKPAAPGAPAPQNVPPPDPLEQRAELASAPAGPAESMVIKVVSDDPDIVYYWLVEPTSS